MKNGISFKCPRLIWKYWLNLAWCARKWWKRVKSLIHRTPCQEQHFLPFYSYGNKGCPFCLLWLYIVLLFFYFFYDTLLNGNSLYPWNNLSLYITDETLYFTAETLYFTAEKLYFTAEKLKCWWSTEKIKLRIERQ